MDWSNFALMIEEMGHQIPTEGHDDRFSKLLKTVSFYLML